MSVNEQWTDESVNHTTPPPTDTSQNAVGGRDGGGGGEGEGGGREGDDQHTTDTMMQVEQGVVMEVVDICGDGGCVKKVIKHGTPNTKPMEGAEVMLHYVGKFTDGRVFDSSKQLGRPYKFKLGLEQVIKGWDKCVETMNTGEIVTLICKPEYAFGIEGCPPNIPPNSTIIFEEMELISFKKPIETTEERVEECTRIKNEGNNFFKEGNYTEAARLYQKALDVWYLVTPREEEGKKKMQDAQLPVLLNLAACQLKLKDYKSAWLSCEKSLDIDAKNVKAIFRRGQSFFGQGEFQKAKEDYITAIKLDPNNKELRKALDDLKKQEEDYKKKQQALYSKMGSMFG